MTTMEPPADSGPADRTVADPEEAVLEAAARAVDPMEQQVDMTPLDVPRRLLLVHAHPDDETIGTGATMARYAAEGALVTLLTCTLGEEGEVLVDDLSHLAAHESDGLGHHRVGELAVAMEALGVRDHRFLGGAGRWRDSGMMGTPANDRPGCFWRADLDEATRELVAVLRAVRPQVVVTYDENGGYGHPDHIQAHRVTVAAYDASGDPSRYPDVGEPWQPVKLYFTALPKSVIQAGIDYFRERGDTSLWGPEVQSADDVPMGIPDDQVTTVIEAYEHFDAKMAAMRAHATQIAVNGPFFALADGIGQRAWGAEYFVLDRGPRGDGDGPNGWETDLFSGLPA